MGSEMCIRDRIYFLHDNFRAIKSNPKDPPAYENLAALYYKRGDIQKSKELYDLLLSISSPSHDDHRRKYVLNLKTIFFIRI